MGAQFARLRGLGVALVVLVLSAGAVLAGGDGPPSAADQGLGIAGERAGQTVPVGQGDEATDADAAPEADEDAEEVEADAELDEDGAADTHGALVSEAARMETPEGFLTHGEWVSCVARMNRGQLGPDFDPSTVDLAALTPEDCDGTDEAATGEESDVEATTTEAGPGKSLAARARRDARGPHGNSANH